MLRKDIKIFIGIPANNPLSRNFPRLADTKLLLTRYYEHDVRHNGKNSNKKNHTEDRSLVRFIFFIFFIFQSYDMLI